MEIDNNENYEEEDIATEDNQDNACEGVAQRNMIIQNHFAE